MRLHFGPEAAEKQEKMKILKKEPGNAHIELLVELAELEKELLFGQFLSAPTFGELQLVELAWQPVEQLFALELELVSVGIEPSFHSELVSG